MNAKTFRLITIVLLLFQIGALATLARAADEAILFGPVTTLRETGKPTNISYTFPKLPGFEQPFRLVVTNGNNEGRARISSALIYLNGALVLSPSDLNQKIGEVSRQVGLLESNTLTVNLRSKPGSFLKVTIVGQRVDLPEQVLDQASVTVGPGGGAGALANFATVTLPESPPRPNLSLKLEKITSSSKTTLYRSETVGTGPSLPEILRITSSENISTPVAVAVQIPPAFVNALPQGFRPELFAEFTQLGAHGEIISSYERLGAIYDSIRSVAYASIPPHAFTPANSVTTSIVVGSYAGAPTTQVTGNNTVPSQAVQATPNQVLPLAADLTFSIPPQIGNPLQAALTVNDDFGPRLHPITGQPSFHSGIDLDTNSQPVYSALPGTAVASGPQSPCTLVNGVCMTGFGHRVRIDHGNGLTTVYAHLEPDGLPAVGSQVTANTQIGTSDTTGTATGDHLHFEYRINGNPVDPILFTAQQDAARYLVDLSVVALVNGQSVEATRRSVSGAQVTGNTALFPYQAQLDLVPLQLPSGSTNQLSIVVQNASGASATIVTVPLTINPLPLRATLRWDKVDTDVDLHVRDSLGNESWYANLCGIPNGCLDRDDVDGFGPEVFDLTTLAPGVSYTVFLHYFSDHGNGPTTATVVIEQGTQTFGPFVRTLSTGQTSTIGVFPQ